PPPPTSTLFPYTTLFRSLDDHVLNPYTQRVGYHLRERRRVALAMTALPCGDGDGAVRLDGDARDVEQRFQPSHPCGLCDLGSVRSEEHTSELQSLAYLVC